MFAGLQTLNRILQTKDYNFIVRNCLDRDYFKGYEKEFDFIENHYRMYGNVPDIPTFTANFEQFQLIEVNESESYLMDRLHEEYGYHQFVPVIPEVSRLLQTDSRDAYEYLLTQMPNLKPKHKISGYDIIKNAGDRYDTYVNRADSAEFATIKTGLPELDEVLGGWEMGDELVTMVARINQGKSWLLMKFLTEAWKQGKRVGLYSGEMNPTKLGYRFDALFAHFSNRCLTYGGQTDGYKEFIDNLKKMPNPFIIAQQKDFGGRPTPQKIRHFIEANQLDIVGIDQYSLMDDGRANVRDPLRLRMAHITEDLFILSSEYRIPILGLAQANREGIKKDDSDEAPGLENIKESDDIAANSSKAIGMRQAPYGGMILDIIKNREGRVGDKLIYSWDIDTAHFSYIPSSGDAAKPEMRQQVQQQTKAQFASSSNPF